MENTITNKVASSSILTFDLEDIYPQGKRMTYDIKQNLFQELLLREKDFREFVKTHDWTQYRDAFVHITCSVDAIVPTWAFMVVMSHIEPYAKKVIVGTKDELERVIFEEVLEKVDWQVFHDQKVVVKGCSNYAIPHAVYAEATRRLAPIAKLVMFGEACSSVPVYKKPKLK